MFARRVLPRRIILVRHGESEGNVDESMYCRVPDPKISLTDTVRSPPRLLLFCRRGTLVRYVERVGSHMLDSTRRAASRLAVGTALPYSVSLSISVGRRRRRAEGSGGWGLWADVLARRARRRHSRRGRS